MSASIATFSVKLTANGSSFNTEMKAAANSVVQLGKASTIGADEAKKAMAAIDAQVATVQAAFVKAAATNDSSVNRLAYQLKRLDGLRATAGKIASSVTMPPGEVKIVMPPRGTAQKEARDRLASIIREARAAGMTDTVDAAIRVKPRIVSLGADQARVPRELRRVLDRLNEDLKQQAKPVNVSPAIRIAPVRNDVERAARAELAAAIRASRAQLRQQKVEVLIGIRPTADVSAGDRARFVTQSRLALQRLKADVDKAVPKGGFLSGLKSAFGEESNIGRLGKLAIGAGALAGVSMVTRAFADLSRGIREVSDLAADGAGGIEIADHMTRAVPIIGDVYTGMYEIGDAILGISSDIKSLEALNKALDADREAADRLRAVVKDLASQTYEIRMRMSFASAIAGTSDVGQQAVLAAQQAQMEALRNAEKQYQETLDKINAEKQQVRKSIVIGRGGVRQEQSTVVGKLTEAEATKATEAALQLRNATVASANQAFFAALTTSRDQVLAPFNQQLQQAQQDAYALQQQLANPTKPAALVTLQVELERAQASLKATMGEASAAQEASQLLDQLTKQIEETDRLKQSVEGLNAANADIKSLQEQIAAVGKTGEQVRIDWMKQVGVPPEVLAQLTALQKQLEETKAADAFKTAMQDVQEQLDQIGKTPIEVKVSGMVKDKNWSKEQADEYRKALDKLDAAQAANDLGRELATPMEKAQEQLDRLDKALAGGLSADKYAVGVAKVQDELKRAMEESSFSGKVTDQLASAATSITASNRLDQAFRNQQSRISDSGPKSAEAKRQKTAEEANRLLARMERLLKEQTEFQIVEMNI